MFFKRGLAAILAAVTVVGLDLASELRHRNTTLFTVGLIGLEVFTTERPSIRIVALDNRVEYSYIVAAIAGVAGVKTVYHVGADFDR